MDGASLSTRCQVKSVTMATTSLTRHLTTTFLNNKSSCSPRQLRHTDFISQLTTDLRYIIGTNNSPADALSRNISAVTSSLINYAVVATDQTADPEIQDLSGNPAFQFKKILLPGTGVHIYADVSTETSRPFLPKDHRLPVFHKLHNLSHPGIRANQKMMTSRFIWPNINKDVRHTDSVTRAFINTWISRFGVPLSLTFDRGNQFKSNVWNKLMNILGTQRIRTASYHPQANGTVERFHRQLKTSLATSAQRDDWSQALPLALLGIRTSFKEDLQHSSAELVYVTTLKLPGQLLAPAPNSTSCHLQDYTAKLTDYMRSLQPVQLRTPSFKNFLNQDLDTCTQVLITIDAVKKHYNNLTMPPSRYYGEIGKRLP
ncbi:uncharacterized protein LOC143039797 [Oratosquilla oratoria]|uniref:uncharacterized protein LOC143039797 n=1 Tax=Oratosquilla oratoria TaxID=337810 RepID=UPI003F776F38